MSYPTWTQLMWNPKPGASGREWLKPFRKSGLPDFACFIVGFDPFAPDHTDGQMMKLWAHCAELNWYTRNVLIRTTHEQRLREWFALWLDVEDPCPDFTNARGPAAVRATFKSGRSELFARMLDTMGDPPPGCAFPLYDWMQGPLYWPDMLPGVSIELNGAPWKPARTALGALAPERRSAAREVPT